MWSLRSFLNTDTPVLSKIWNQHHASIDSNSTTSVSIWDAAVLSKPYFIADELILAIDPIHGPVGFVHFGFVGNRGLELLSEDHAAIHALCVLPGPDEDAIADFLLTNADAALASRGAKSCSALGGGERSGFYLGIADGDNLMGVLASDTKSQRWFSKAGYQPVRPTECWELDLSMFRPPMDRNQIQARRSCSVGQILDENFDDWWTSVVLGHCDQSRFHLMAKPASNIVALLKCWYPDPSILGLDSSVIRLILEEPPESVEAREQFVYLLAESLRQLQQERKRLVQAVVSAEKHRTVSLLNRLGFKSTLHGLILEKAYQPGESAWGIS